MKRLKINMIRGIQILIIEPGKPPRATRMKNMEYAFAEIVGGPIARYAARPASLVLLIANEQAEEQELPPNRRIPLSGGSSGDAGCICGTFLVCGVAENSYVSLTSGQQDEFMGYFAGPGEFMVVDGWDGRSVCCYPRRSDPERGRVVGLDEGRGERDRDEAGRHENSCCKFRDFPV